MLLLAISPYFIINSRFGLDCNLLLHFMAISICLFIYSLDSKHKNLMLLLSGICFGLTFYTYILSLIICSITIFLFIIYSLYIKKINIKNVIVFLIPIFIFIIPYILLYLVNTGVINEINGIVSIPKLYPFRSNEISLKNIVNNLYIFKSLLTYDKEEVLLYMSSCIKYGTLYYFSIPFVIIGFIYLIKDLYYIIKLKKFDIKFYIFSWLIAVIICMLIIENPNINKSNAIFIPLVYLCSLGIIKIIKNNYSIFYIIMILYITSFISFLNYLFYNYNYDNNSWFSSCDYSLALKYIDNNYSNRKYIHLELIDKNKAEYIYLALHYKLNPYENDVIPYNISDNDRYFIDDKIYDFNVKDIDTNQIYILRSQWLIDRIKNSNYIYKCKKIENYYVLIT